MLLKTKGAALLPPPRDGIERYPARTTEKLRFADTDRNGHITNSVFAVCCQNARMELLLRAGGGTLPEGMSIAVVRLELDFVGEMHWPGSVEIGTRVDRVGRSSLGVAQGLFFDGRCVGRSRSVAVLVDAATRQATPLPAAFAEALREFSVGEDAASLPPASLLRRLINRVRLGARLPKERLFA